MPRVPSDLHVAVSQHRAFYLCHSRNTQGWASCAVSDAWTSHAPGNLQPSACSMMPSLRSTHAACYDRKEGVTRGELPVLEGPPSSPSRACMPPPMSSSAAASCGSQTPSPSICESSAVSSSSARRMYSCRANLRHACTRSSDASTLAIVYFVPTRTLLLKKNVFNCCTSAGECRWAILVAVVGTSIQTDFCRLELPDLPFPVV